MAAEDLNSQAEPHAHDGHTHDRHAHDGHSHEAVPDDDDGPPGDFELLSRAIQELLEEKGLITADQIRAVMEAFEDDYPFRGPRVIARAWADPAFRQRLLADGKAACAEMGINLEADRLIAVENTPGTHNLIVCTLCSCYPRALMGMPPSWYKSSNYRARAVYEPRAVLREFGTVLADDVTIRVHDSNADMRYVVIPMRPEGTEDMNEDELARLLTRDMLVGVTLPKPPG